MRQSMPSSPSAVNAPNGRPSRYVPFDGGMLLIDMLPDPERLTLENGLRLIIAKDPTAPVAATGFWTDAGVCDERTDRRGIAHFIEHMMFRGSENVPSQEHARRIAQLGGDCNAFTSPDTTVYHERVPSESIEEVFRLESDRLMRLRLADKEMQVERKVILEELHAYENQPATRAMLAIQKEISAGHPYALSPLGRREDLEATELADLEAFYRRCYRPDRVVAVVCGDVEVARVADLAQKYFGDWRSPNERNEVGDPPDFKPALGRMSLRLSMEVPVVAQVYQLDPLQDIDRPALELLVALLSSGASSPLREELVRKRRLCVEAACSNMLGAQGGLLIFFGVFLPPGRHARRRTVMAEMIDRFVEQGPNPEQFDQHLKQFRIEWAKDTYSHEDRVLGLGNAELLEGGFERYHHGLEELSKVTPPRIQALARTIFAADNRLELDITPEQSHWWLVPIGLFMRFLAR